jgi:hypothetical protein
VLRTFDGESFPLVAIYGRDPRIVEQMKQLGPIRIFGLLNTYPLRAEPNNAVIREGTMASDQTLLSEALSEIRIGQDDAVTGARNRLALGCEFREDQTA